MVCVLFLFIPRVIIYFKDPPEILITTEQVQRFRERSELVSSTKNEYSSLTKKEENRVKRQYFAPQNRFNPNEYELADWMALGLSEKQSQSVLNFIKRGIYSNNSLQKIYVLPKQVYELIKDSTYYERKVSSDDFTNVNKSSEMNTLLEINTADHDDLMGLNGIGEFYANQIIRYRDELGGFIFKEQLLEVWKMRLETYDKVLPQIHLDSSIIQKMNINKCDMKALKSHPYLDYYQANSVVKMRQQKGRFFSLDELLESKLIDEEEFKRIRPYLYLD